MKITLREYDSWFWITTCAHLVGGIIFIVLGRDGLGILLIGFAIARYSGVVKYKSQKPWQIALVSGLFLSVVFLVLFSHNSRYMKVAQKRQAEMNQKP